MIFFLAMELKAQTSTSLDERYLKNLTSFERGWSVVPELVATPLSVSLGSEKILREKSFQVYKKDQWSPGLKQASVSKNARTFLYPVIYHPHHQKVGILTGKVILKLKPGVSLQDLSTIILIDSSQSYPHLKSIVVKASIGQDMSSVLQALRQSGLVDSAEAEILSGGRKAK